MPTKTHKQTREVPAPEAGTNSHAPAEERVLTFADIVAAEDTKYEDVPTPEWGGITRVASLTGTERQTLVTGMRKDQDDGGDEIALIRFAFRVVAASIVDEDGQHVSEQEEAVVQLATKNMEPVQRVFDTCRRLSGLGQEELDTSLDELKETPSASSATD